MATDDERREVAERLRSLVTDDSVYADVEACCVLHRIGLYYKDIDRIYFSGFDVARLADLIDPAQDHFADSGKKVDRDALLALADKMDRYASLRKSHGMDVDAMAVGAWVHRIREALGVTGHADA